MLLHPIGELRRPHEAGLYRDVSEVRGGDGLLVAICRRGQTAEHRDDLDHETILLLRQTLAPLTALTVTVSGCSLTASCGGKMPSYFARASRIGRARPRSYFGMYRITSPMFAPSVNQKMSLRLDDFHPFIHEVRTQRRFLKPSRQ
jgi:hypothetical protein